MKPTLIHLTERQIRKIKEEAENKGLSMAEVVRRILDEYIDKKKDV